MLSFAIIPALATAALATVANVPTSLVDADKDVHDAGIGPDQIVAKFVRSSDGAQIYAEAVGDPSNPPIVLVPGYTLSTISFDKQFEDQTMREQLYMVCYFTSRPIDFSDLVFLRSAWTLAGTARVR